MRQIKFRGKRLDNGEWVYGSLIQNVTDKSVNVAFIVPYLPCSSEPHDMCTAEMFRVNPPTTGQFTDLTDSNGKEIYEGDIVKNEYEDVGSITMFRGEWRVDWGADDIFSIYDELKDELVVIGNIHDNPELLKIKQDEDD